MGAVAEDVRRTGTLAAANGEVDLNQPGTSVVAVNLVVTGTNTTVFEATIDEGASPTWVAVKALNVNSGSLVASATASGLFKVDMSGYRTFRVRCSSYTNGNVVATLNGSVAPSAPGLISASAAGAGAATIADGADVAEGATTDAAVTGDNAGSVSAKLRGLSKILADMWDSTNHWLQVKLMTGANVIGAVTQSGTWTVQPGNTANTTAWKVDGSAVTQPVSGTVTANAAQSGTWTVQPGNTANTTAWKVDGSAVTQPVSGTVSANATLQAGTATAGNIGGLTKTVTTTLTRPANTTTYTAGDEMTDTGGTIRTISSIAVGTGKGGIITHCLLSCSSNGATKPTFNVYVYDTTSTPQTDNAAFAPADGEQDTCIGSFTLSTANAGDATASTGNFTMDSGQIHIPYTSVGAADLYFRVQVTNGYTPGANSDTYKFRFKAQQDA